MAERFGRGLQVRDADAHDIDYVVRRMRPEDEREVYGARWSADPTSLASEIWHGATEGRYCCLYTLASAYHPRPVAIAGVYLSAPHVGWAHLIATPEWPKIATDATRFIRDRMIPQLHDAGMRRVELRALKSWSANCRWLQKLGAVLECECAGLGAEPYLQFAWTRKEAA